MHHSVHRRSGRGALIPCVEVVILPEPDPGVREALLEALAMVGGESEQPSAYRSAWRRAALDPADDDELFGG